MNSCKGKSVKEKIDSVKSKLVEENVDYLIVSRLDSVAWLLNLRGLDIPYSPVFISYVVVKKDGTTSFYPRDGDKITKEILDHLRYFWSYLVAQLLKKFKVKQP